MGCFNSKVSTDKAHGHGKAGSHAEVSSASKGSSHKNSLRLDTTDANVSLKTLTFRHVMHDPLGREFFMKFLKKEHAEENLIFFEEVEKLKEVPEYRFLDCVEELVQTFLIPGVETEVNISDGMKTNLIKMASGDLTDKEREFLAALERAQNEIMMILAMGAFPRFLKSPLFHEYKRKAREEREKEDEQDIRKPEGL